MNPEEASLVGEIIKISDKWLDRAFGPAVEQAGGMLGDWMQDKRQLMQYNRRKVAEKVKTIMIEEGVTPKELSSKVLVPMLEGISLEDDDFLQDIWARLFVNYVDKDKSLKVTVYPDILRQLSTGEARIIKDMLKSSDHSVLTGESQTSENPNDYEEIANLVRLGLIEPELSIHENNNFGKKTSILRTTENEKYFLTQAGYHFLAACGEKIE